MRWDRTEMRCQRSRSRRRFISYAPFARRSICIEPDSVHSVPLTCCTWLGQLLTSCNDARVIAALHSHTSTDFLALRASKRLAQWHRFCIVDVCSSIQTRFNDLRYIKSKGNWAFADKPVILTDISLTAVLMNACRRCCDLLILSANRLVSEMSGFLVSEVSEQRNVHEAKVSK